MKINDLRFEKKELSWDDLEHGEVYVSSRYQKYLFFSQANQTICLDTGEVFDKDEHKGDTFTHVQATMEIR